MWKALASIVCGCLAALPLIGCTGDVGAPRATAAAPRATVDRLSYAAERAVYGAPAAVLVFLPAMGGASGDEALARDPALWAAQGFDVVLPQPADIYRLVADQRAAMARLVASARTLADAPVWLVGPSSAIDAALATAAPFGRGGISGVVVTSVTSNSGGCSESVFYSDRGYGEAPQIRVSRSGDCGGNLPAFTGRQPSVVPAPPTARPREPRIIEASAMPKNLPPAAKVRRLAQLIKAAPSS